MKRILGTWCRWMSLEHNWLGLKALIYPETHTTLMFVFHKRYFYKSEGQVTNIARSLQWAKTITTSSLHNTRSLYCITLLCIGMSLFLLWALKYSICTAQLRWCLISIWKPMLSKYVLAYIQQCWSRPNPRTFSPHYHLSKSPLPGPG